MVGESLALTLVFNPWSEFFGRDCHCNRARQHDLENRYVSDRSNPQESPSKYLSGESDCPQNNNV